MNSARVGIIGINGKYGRCLEGFFKTIQQESRLVDRVIGSDIGTTLTSHELVRNVDVVVVAVPPRVTVEVIEEIASYLSETQLIMDVTSIKVAPVQAMMQSCAEVVGLHPMCAPPRNFSWQGQIIVVCPGRLFFWQQWLNDMLRLTGARLKYCTPSEHDKHMAVVQGLVHATELMMASAIRRGDIQVAESLTFTSPVYRIALSLMGRILNQDPHLYADIQMLNPPVAQMLRHAADSMNDLATMVEGRDYEAFMAEFMKNRDHMGSTVLQDSFDLFELISQLLTDHASTDQITLEVEHDRPGILRDIAAIFAEEGINLLSWHSFRAGSRVRFRIGCDRVPTSVEMMRVISYIIDDKLAIVV